MKLIHLNNAKTKLPMSINIKSITSISKLLITSPDKAEFQTEVMITGCGFLVTDDYDDIVKELKEIE